MLPTVTVNMFSEHDMLIRIETLKSGEDSFHVLHLGDLSVILPGQNERADDVLRDLALKLDAILQPAVGIAS